MVIKDNLRNIMVILLPLLIGFSIPYTLLLNQMEPWQLVLITIVIAAIFLLLLKYRISLLYFGLFSLFGLMNTALKPFDLMLVLMFLLMLVLSKRKLFHLSQLKLVHLCLFLFLLINIISILNSSVLLTGFDYFIHTVFVISIFYFVFMFANEETLFKSVLWGYILSTIISALLIVAEFLGWFTGLNTLFQGLRASGLFLDPNDFAPYLMLAILYMLYLFSIKPLASYHSYLFLITGLFLTGTLLASLSRAAILNLLISVALFFLFHLLNRGSIKHFVIFLFTILISGLTVIYYLKDSIKNWFAARFFASDGMLLQAYDTDRFYFQMQGIEMGSTNLFGIGPGQFEILMNYATHNLYIRIIAENGWLATIPFLIMLGFILIQLWKHRNEKIWGIPFYLFLSGYIGLLVNSFFLDTLHWRYFWVYLGLCCVLLKNVNRVNNGVGYHGGNRQ
jgi:O-antigen ligase